MPGSVNAAHLRPYLLLFLCDLFMLYAKILVHFVMMTGCMHREFPST